MTDWHETHDEQGAKIPQFVKDKAEALAREKFDKRLERYTDSIDEHENRLKCDYPNCDNTEFYITTERDHQQPPQLKKIAHCTRCNAQCFIWY
jgi:hypothetical protein